MENCWRLVTTTVLSSSTNHSREKRPSLGRTSWRHVHRGDCRGMVTGWKTTCLGRIGFLCALMGSRHRREWGDLDGKHNPKHVVLVYLFPCILNNMETFFTFLEKRVDDCSSLLCIGLDPRISDLTEPNAASARDFCLNLVKQTAPYAAAFKPNAAFFEVFGAEGWTALKQVIDAIHEESARMGSMIPVIFDAKRSGIASTAEAYAKSAFETLGAHCITLNPYLGHDSIEPFIQNSEKGVFLLCKTSNAGSMDLQNLLVLPMLFLTFHCWASCAT
jgi:hypothetical protein